MTLLSGKKRIGILAVFFIFAFLSVSTLFADSPYEGFEEKGDIIYYNGEMVTSISLQKNSDIIRLRHLEYYGNLIEEYHEKTGKYPFQTESKIPTYVYVANSRQIGFTRDYDAQIPQKHNTVSFKEFIAELERVLGREIDEYYDPQFYPDLKWNWYVYAIYEDVYYFAVHIHQKFHFSKLLGPYSCKVEISNVPRNGQNIIFDPKELFKDKIFRAVTDKQVEKEGYFKEREEMFLNETKTLD